MLFLAKVASYCTSAFSILSSVAVIDRILLSVSKSKSHCLHIDSWQDWLQQAFDKYSFSGSDQA